MPKKRWIIAVVVIAIITTVLIILRIKYRPPITMVQAKSLEINCLDIAWYDDEIDQIYTVYWSDKPGINIRDPDTYCDKQNVATAFSAANHKIRLNVECEYVYFRIGKHKTNTREFEARVRLDNSFTKENLDVRILSNSWKNSSIGITMELNVLKNADYYRIYYYYPDSESFYQTIDTRNMKNVLLKINLRKEAVICISYLQDEFESNQEFLMYNEKISPKALKWTTRIKHYSL